MRYCLVFDYVSSPANQRQDEHQQRPATMATVTRALTSAEQITKIRVWIGLWLWFAWVARSSQSDCMHRAALFFGNFHAAIVQKSQMLLGPRGPWPQRPSARAPQVEQSGQRSVGKCMNPVYVDPVRRCNL